MRRHPTRTAIVAIVAVIAIIALAVLLSGCGNGSPSGDPSVTGAIRQIDANSDGATILVVGGGTVDRASVRVTPSTRILVGAGPETTDGAVRDLVTGVTVRVWFTGPVAESYPVQATAGTVLVEK